MLSEAAKTSDRHPSAMFLSLFGCLSVVYSTRWGAIYANAEAKSLP
jgi:hypothetical protein